VSLLHMEKSGVAPKEEAIIEAATRLFFRQGLERTSMEAIAREAGVAKQTVYSYFNGKEELFGAIIRARCTALLDMLPQHTAAHPSAKDYLTALAEGLMDMLFREETREFYRLVVSESPRFPELGRVYYESGPQQALDMLAAYFTRHGTPAAESQIFAKQFFGMLTGHFICRALLDKNYRPPETERRAFINTVVATFTEKMKTALPTVRE
jgi:TetR/AcrR family transcriptional regulator, mexJK operon transcriptional repressor